MFPTRNPKNDDSSLISKYLKADQIIFLDVETRDQALSLLVDLLDKQGKLKDKTAFSTAIHVRERIVSTGIGMGVAIPHAKLPTYEDFFIAVGIHRKGIPWDSIDGVPVRLVFMIGGPDNKQTEYLQLLSKLTLLIKNEEKRKKMLQSESGEEMIALLTQGG
jgi:PTS system nitrogen regulatory IIA component